MSRTVWVIDSVALFDIKREVTANDQWDVMKRLEVLVEDGTVVISEQVAREAGAAQHVDLPEAWVLGVYRRGPHGVTTNPSNPNYLNVMSTVGPQIVDPAAESDPADPWVLALALDM